MRYLLFFITMFTYIYTPAQVKLYVSKTTGQFSDHSGSYSKTTDEYESANYSISTEGPIKVEIKPHQLYISPKESVSWTGRVYPDTSKAPEESMSAKAAIKYNGTKTFSRPAIGAQNDSGKIESTHNCKGCSKHPGGGKHEVVTQKSSGEIAFVVHTLGLKIEGPDCAYYGSKLTQKAVGTPAGEGTYQWKSIDTDVLEVTGKGAEAIVTCKTKTGVGKGKIAAQYTVNGIRHYKIKEITFFKLIPDLSKKGICDGEGIKVTMRTSPTVEPASVKECISNIKVVSEPIVGKGETAVNVINTTDINFSKVADDLSSKADTIYWFIPDKKKDKCIFNCKYNVWVEADNKFGADKIETLKRQLGVSVSFSNCVNGDANIYLTVARLDIPVYKNMKVGKGEVTFDQPETPHPAFKVILDTNKQGIPTMRGSFSVGNFKLGTSVTRVFTNKSSQFYPLAEFEENFHADQFGGKTQIPELKNMLSAQQVIDRVNAQIPASPYNPNNAAAVFNKHTEACWKVFIKEVAAEVKEFNELSAQWAILIRCRLEQEAKVALKAKFGDIFTVDMPCAYPNCLKKK